MGILNARNPRLANYVRGAKAIGVAERLITPRGGSNYLTQTESALSGVGAHAPVSAIDQAAAYRQALVDGLAAHGVDSAPAAKSLPNETRQQMWDRLVKKEKMSPEVATAAVKKAIP